MKYLLAFSQIACLLAVLRPDGNLRHLTARSYRLTLAFLAFAIPVTLAFRSDSTTWLNHWYPLLVGPLALLRLAAGLEIAHRQTEGFRYWWRLMGSVFLIAGMFAGLAWVQSDYRDTLRSVVEFRRLLQIFGGAVFLVLEGFWISQGGGFYRRSDQLAGIWALMALSHATVSVLAGIDQYSDFSKWVAASEAAWMVDTVCFFLLAIRFQGGRTPAPRSI